MSLSKLKQVGLRTTQPRLRVLEMLDTLPEPLSAQEIAERIDGVDQATVYRTLEHFVAKGLARRVDVRKERVLYEKNDEHDHHHLVCTSCNRIEDFSGCAFESLSEHALSHSKYFASVTSHSFELFGTCRSCAR